jgi:zinc and cadmium transporter
LELGIAVVAGFSVFFILEQFLHWHHCHRAQVGCKKPLTFNALSGLTFLAGGLMAYGLSFQLDISLLIPFAAGNFIYIGASDLVPEVNKHGELDFRNNVLHLCSFGLGLAILLLAAH